MPCRATQDRQVMVESSHKMWSTGEGSGKPLQYSCLENAMNSMKRQKDSILKDELPQSVGAQYATGNQWRNNSRKNEGMQPKQKQSHPKGNQSWIFIGRTDGEPETPILWAPDAKNWLIWRDPDAGRDRRWEEKGMTENEMVEWHHQLNGCEFEWTPGAGHGQGGLVCCSPWGHKESDTTEPLNWAELSSGCCAKDSEGAGLKPSFFFFPHIFWRICFQIEFWASEKWVKNTLRIFILSNREDMEDTE